MKPHIVALIGFFVLPGFNVPAWGNLTVLAITFALFFATLSLGRHIAPRSESGGSTNSVELFQRK